MFFNRTFNERKDRYVFCNGKMFDKKMFPMRSGDKCIMPNVSSIWNMCKSVKAFLFLAFWAHFVKAWNRCFLNVRLKNAFLFLIRSFIVSYPKVMNSYRESVDKRGIKLVVFYIGCPQVIGLQLYTESSKPRRNTLFYRFPIYKKADGRALCTRLPVHWKQVQELAELNKS